MKTIAHLLLAHGAGQGMGSEFMQQAKLSFAEQGIQVHLFDFPYMQKAKALDKKRPPDRMPKLEEAYLSQLQQLQQLQQQVGDQLPIFIGGKSMGGRVASHLLTQTDIKVAGGIALGYPFHPPGKQDKLRIAHFPDLCKPLLIAQGERDTFGKRAFVEALPLPSTVQVTWVSAGDHSFKATKASGIQWHDNIKAAAIAAKEFVQDVA